MKNDRMTELEGMREGAAVAYFRDTLKVSWFVFGRLRARFWS
jgi:hypothetical protein